MKCPKCGHEFAVQERPEEERGNIQKKGMIKKSAEGRHMSRAPLGYEWNLKDKMLVPSQSSREIQEIFEEFLQPDINLSILASKHNLSVNGLKKVLKNFAYVGKVKFDGQIHEGKHQTFSFNNFI